MHSHGDKMALIHLHLRHLEDCTAATAREKHYDTLGGACARFLRMKEKQEYDKYRQTHKDNTGKAPAPPAYQYLAIQRVAGGVRTTQPHSETKKRPLGTGAGEQRASGTGDSDESEEREGEGREMQKRARHGTFCTSTLPLTLSDTHTQSMVPSVRPLCPSLSFCTSTLPLTLSDFLPRTCFTEL
jgi:hypothetical protein